ncbi:MAG: hypothetical protein CMJ31_11395 [Phycisphaerae bacterium]|nr:hypothetical protein [Phycisphaerae bacterium]
MTSNTADQISSFTAGQTIRCTLNVTPAAKGPRDTVARLMRRDPANVRALRRAQHLRKRRLNRYIRGNRLWTSREKAARVVQVRPGLSWEMSFTPDVSADLRSVAKYLDIKTA